ncbi:MAG: helix-turn-helix domain-containing protein [Thermomicrobiales bacterium]
MAGRAGGAERRVGALDNLEVTVTAADDALDVSRPALSNLLNGHASISPEMAVRLS